jgi:hypothetical protein
LKEKFQQELKERITKKVFNFFINSNDFNGISLSELANKLDVKYKSLLPIIKELILEDIVSIQGGENPHIIRFNHYDKNLQIEFLREAENNEVKCIEEISGIENFDSDFSIKIMTESHLLCAYPTLSYLKNNRNTEKFEDSPYSKRLALGEPQLTYVFFELNVLERYFNDPRYSFHFRDYSGYFSCLTSDQNSNLKDIDQIFLESFGLGYDNNNDRVIVVFLRYLRNLTPEHQYYWKTKEVSSECKILKEYFENAILGEWSTGHSFFSAFIQDQLIINDVSKLITGNNLFIETFEESKRPKEFTFFTTPTLHNYERFILLLDKMISDNINKDFFKNSLELSELVKMSETVVEKRDKGTLKLLEEWLKTHYRLHDKKGYKLLLAPLKKVRKERQKPAHKISEDYYDKNFYYKQMKILKEVYESIYNLKYIFLNHPLAKEYKIPEWLAEFEIKEY